MFLFVITLFVKNNNFRLLYLFINQLDTFLFLKYDPQKV